MRPGVHSDFSRMTSRSEIIPSQKSASRRSLIDLPEARFWVASGLSTSGKFGMSYKRRV